MHSSGMRTFRLLTVSQHALWWGGLPDWGGCVPAWGSVPAWGVYLPGGCTCPGGVPAQESVPAWGSVCTCPGTPCPVNRMTDR